MGTKIYNIPIDVVVHTSLKIEAQTKDEAIEVAEENIRGNNVNFNSFNFDLMPVMEDEVTECQ